MLHSAEHEPGMRFGPVCMNLVANVVVIGVTAVVIFNLLFLSLLSFHE